jgi:hypothetical protein
MGCWRVDDWTERLRSVGMKRYDIFMVVYSYELDCWLGKWFVSRRWLKSLIVLKCEKKSRSQEVRGNDLIIPPRNGVYSMAKCARYAIISKHRKATGISWT